jgi:hypothetical protein
MTFHVFITTPRAGLGFAVAPYTVECKEVWQTRAEAQAFADAKTLSAGVVALFDAMPSLYPAFVAGTVQAPVVYAMGQLCSHVGKTWSANSGHNNAGDPSWAPGGAGNLWTLVPSPGYSQWVYPTFYGVGTKCTDEGQAFSIKQAHNSEGVHRKPGLPGIVGVLWTLDGPATAIQPYTRAVWQVVENTDPDYTEINRDKEA